MTAKNWTKVAPEDMTLDQLQQASRAINSEVIRLNRDLTNMNVANQRIQIQINHRFNVNLPGVQAPESLAEYPADALQAYEFPADE